ncbi:MAG: hypothetical protein KDC38_14415, partial [Planctomycetes bacterium]|nr:hypothetical protein [Planctomycetota bacterium]
MRDFRSLRTAPILLLSLVGCAMQAEIDHPARPADRAFHIRYEATVSDLTAGEPCRVWIPIPSDDPHQRIRNVKVTPSSSTVAVRTTDDPKYGNRMAYLDGVPSSDVLTVTIDYDVDRWENHPELSKMTERDTAGDVAFA